MVYRSDRLSGKNTQQVYFTQGIFYDISHSTDMPY